MQIGVCRNGIMISKYISDDSEKCLEMYTQYLSYHSAMESFKHTVLYRIGPCFQFVLETPYLPGRSCTDKPVFVTPTPLDTDVLRVKLGDTLFLGFYAKSDGTRL